MGNLEKLLVVGVLVVVIAILAVSLFWTSDVSRIPDFEDVSQTSNSTALQDEQVANEELQNSQPATSEALNTLSQDSLAQQQEETSNTLEQSTEQPVVGKTPEVDYQAEPLFPPAMENDFAEYTVKSGDTLGGIALKHRISLSELKKANEGLDPRKLSVGSVILIPGVSGTATTQQPVPTNASATQTKTVDSYKVKKGDTLWKISKTVYGDGSKWKKILDANRDKLPNPDRLRVGMKLSIPQ